jgi:hypothetical protein
MSVLRLATKVVHSISKARLGIKRHVDTARHIGHKIHGAVREASHLAEQAGKAYQTGKMIASHM